MMWCEIEHLFTFQYVSINTSSKPVRCTPTISHLHSNMFLLILQTGIMNVYEEHHLHSNMFLLILSRLDRNGVRRTEFTFQYVSINTNSLPTWTGKSSSFTFQYVSINTHKKQCPQGGNPSFTFQYVSINTVIGIMDVYDAEAYLHSNMFLLIRHTRK